MRLVISLLLRRPGFDYRYVHVGLMVDKDSSGRHVFLAVLQLFSRPYHSIIAS